MAWVELTGQRTERSRTYQEGDHFAWEGILAPLHYESVADSGEFDAEVDFSPQRVDNPELDGWRVAQGGWHYALGQPGDKPTDGWVGFGGRQGAHWLKFRLLRVGYLHWPTRAWDDVGGAPTYDRADLSFQARAVEMGSNADSVNVEGVAEWANVWTTPGGGQLSARWRANGDRLKEEVVVNQAAREWVAANHPPATPAAETWFGFVFDLDWSDVPRVVREGVVLDPDADDFADDGQSIVLQDALERLLGFLPVSQVKVRTAERPFFADLRKRFWHDAPRHYLLVGVRVDHLQDLPAGDLIFDPTVDKQVGASGDDGFALVGDGLYVNWDEIYMGDSGGTDCHAFYRWTTVTISGTITTSYIEIDQWAQIGTGVLMKVYGVDEDNPAAPTTLAEFNADPLTTAAVDWDADFGAGWNQSPSLNTVFQELVDTYTISNDAVMVQVKDDGSPNNTNNQGRAWDNDTSKAAKLHIEYTTVRVPRYGFVNYQTPAIV